MTNSTTHSPDIAAHQEAVVLVRRAVAEDAHAIAVVHVQSWQSAYRDFMPHDFLEQLSVADRATTWRESISRGSPMLVVESGGVLAGFCAIGHARDGDAGPDDFEIWALYLAPVFWSQGLGCSLWQEALKRLEQVGARNVSLWVIAGNQRAERFYLAAGFEPVKEPLNPVNVAGVVVPHRRYRAPLMRLCERLAGQAGDPPRGSPQAHSAGPVFRKN